MTVGEVTRLLHVSKQTVHEWAVNNTLMPIYEKGSLTFTRKQVEHLHEQQEHRKQQEGKGAGQWTRSSDELGLLPQQALSLNTGSTIASYTPMSAHQMLREADNNLLLKGV
jgi:hypothetical protein